MDLAALRRALRARPATIHSNELTTFLGRLETSESAWRSLVRVLEKEVIPVVSRCYPATDFDEISSVCLSGAFESWVSEWLGRVHTVARVRRLLEEDQTDEAFVALATHPRFRGRRAERAGELWRTHRRCDAVGLVEGTQSARSYFIARARAQINEALRKQRRQSRLMARHCSDASGISSRAGHPAATSQATRAICGAELESRSGERATWRVSALPPAHLLSQDLVDRLRQMLGAIEDLGPEHARVFKLLVEGLSQRRIAEVEGRHPAAISRRVRNLRNLCRVQLLE